MHRTHETMKLSCYCRRRCLSSAVGANYFADVWNFRFPPRRSPKTIAAFSKPRKVIRRDWGDDSREYIFARRLSLTVHRLFPARGWDGRASASQLFCDHKKYKHTIFLVGCSISGSVFIFWLCMRRPLHDWIFVRGECIYSAVVHFALHKRAFRWGFSKKLTSDAITGAWNSAWDVYKRVSVATFEV